MYRLVTSLTWDHSFLESSLMGLLIGSSRILAFTVLAWVSLPGQLLRDWTHIFMRPHDQSTLGLSVVPCLHCVSETTLCLKGCELRARWEKEEKLGVRVIMLKWGIVFLSFSFSAPLETDLA